MSTPAIVTSPAATPGHLSAYRRFTTSRWGAVLHVVVGGILGTGLTLLLILGFIGLLFSGWIGMLLVLPLVPVLVYWVIDLILFRTKGSLLRGLIAGLVSVAGTILLFAMARDSGSDDLELYVGGPLVGMAAVFLSRIKDLFFEGAPTR
jgi:hypothetical protein